MQPVALCSCSACHWCSLPLCAAHRPVQLAARSRPVQRATPCSCAACRPVQHPMQRTALCSLPPCTASCAARHTVQRAALCSAPPYAACCLGSRVAAHRTVHPIVAACRPMQLSPLVAAVHRAARCNALRCASCMVPAALCILVVLCSLPTAAAPCSVPYAARHTNVRNLLQVACASKPESLSCAMSGCQTKTGGSFGQPLRA